MIRFSERGLSFAKTVSESLTMIHDPNRAVRILRRSTALIFSRLWAPPSHAESRSAGWRERRQCKAPTVRGDVPNLPVVVANCFRLVEHSFDPKSPDPARHLPFDRVADPVA